MIVVSVSIEVSPEKLRQWWEVADYHAQLSQSEAGCVGFWIIHQDDAKFLLYEKWANQGALDRHRQTAHYKQWRREVEQVQARPREHKEYVNPRIVFTNGCFDIIHAGHISVLQAARELGDVLVVGLDADEGVRRLKGPGRPVHTFTERAAVLGAMKWVDYVVKFNGNDELLRVIEILRPAIIVKGGDYRPEDVVGGGLVESYGGMVHLVPHTGHSSSAILQGARA